MVMLYIDDTKLASQWRECESLDAAIKFVRDLYGNDCEVGQGGTIVDDEGQVLAEYAKF